MSSPEPSLVSRSRLEFLFDGVFAIALTLLVLELKVPELADRRSAPEMWRALAHDAPTFFSYLLSFAMLGLLWYRHHVQFRHLHRPTRLSMVLHLVMMMAAAAFPFAAALLGRYTVNPATLVVYSGCVGTYQWSSTALWISADRQGALDPELDPQEFLRLRSRALRGSIALLLIFLVSLSRAL
jgi:uncharacterized membrane protein